MIKITLFAAVLLLFAFTSVMSKTSAEVNQDQGYYIFTDSKPDAEYTYLGTIQCKVTQAIIHPNYNGLCSANPTYDQMKADFIKQAKKKYKDGEALIINASNFTADVVKFK